MTQPDTLHDRLEAEINRLLEAARAAKPGYFAYSPLSNAVGEEANPITAYRALFNPEFLVRWLEGELEVLERHQSRAMALGQSAPHVAQPRLCWQCNVDYPCADLISLAHRLGVSVE